MTSLLQGAGLGLRRELMPELKNTNLDRIDFFEIAPENWLYAGGRYAKDLRFFTEQKNFACHGLSLSIGSTEKLDVELLKNIKVFLDEHRISLYTEHLSWCSDDGHLYDLLPIPCTQEAVHWVASRIRQAQEILERQIAFENASYYFSPPGAEMSEAQFICEVVRESGCLLHLDVNNIYVNSQNFNFDALSYLKSLPLAEVCYLHVAGHYVEDDGLIVDTHGADVIDPVWTLLHQAYRECGVDAASLPTCLERDFNFPSLVTLLAEVEQIRRIQAQHQYPGKAAVAAQYQSQRSA
ncbi:DUF692 domain-containing protein [Agaribacterium haliotis]|uniref:HvfB family MNIO-type RiPP peptide maturase n=1 Tax=Agaribacterium haliotis TaxID=2013869 RepID=UPI000BB58320|nr:DUF692 domain-containing protein [Agaribacterium haliotis]